MTWWRHLNNVMNSVLGAFIGASCIIWWTRTSAGEEFNMNVYRVVLLVLFGLKFFFWWKSRVPKPYVLPPTERCSKTVHHPDGSKTETLNAIWVCHYCGIPILRMSDGTNLPCRICGKRPGE